MILFDTSGFSYDNFIFYLNVYSHLFQLPVLYKLKLKFFDTETELCFENFTSISFIIYPNSEGNNMMFLNSL